MNACNPTPMAIHGIVGLASDDSPNQEVDGRVMVTVDKNFFYNSSLEMFIKASVNAIVTSVQRNSVNVTLVSDTIMEPIIYDATYSTANSTEINYYEFGYTEYTQVFSVDYKWEGGKGHTADGNFCQDAADIADVLVEDVPELAEVGEFAAEMCDTVYHVING